MSLSAKRSIIKEDKSNIITLGAIAKEEKKKDPSVINATIGMYYSEDGKLVTYESVNKALEALTDDEKYYDEFMEKTFISCMATPGGSGAISNTFSNYLNEGDEALLPSFMWGNYKQFAYENHASYRTYNLFKDGHLDLDDIKKNIYELKEKQGRVLLVINDPCQNPTGYTMTDSEWVSLVDIINEASADGTPFILLHDMAYIDYDYRGFKSTRNNLRLYEKLNKNVLVVLAFSGSKTLALYGIRIGAQVAISTNEENIKEFARANKFSSRAKWSNTTNLGANLISKVILDKEMRNAFENELEKARDILVKRALAFIEASKEVGLETLPFNCGFFITIPCKNPDEVYKRLVERKIHIIPLGNVLRVTISAITIEDCKRLPKIIKECM